jgi:hypothetical protein
MSIRVKFHSNEPRAIEATDSTIKGLGFDAHLVRDSQGAVVFDADGWAQIDTLNPGYIAFAIKHQGYVADVA